MKFIPILGITLWLSAIAYGLLQVGKYETTAGEQEAPPASFPAASSLRRDPEKPTLLFFAHPKCPCSRASIAELAKLLMQTDGKLNVHVVFSKPTDAPEDWADTPLRQTAEQIPGITVTIDEDEKETSRFNARTSGTALLYDGDGDLRFNGGLTRGRGVEGESDGTRAIAVMLESNFAELPETPVFGCPLQNTSE